jgi:nicotinamide riboside transporter PnuC
MNFLHAIRIGALLMGLMNKLKTQNKEGESTMKSGWKTSEFWTAILSSLVGIMVVLGWITPEMQGALSEAIAQAAGGLISIVSIVAYILSRTKVKAEESKKTEVKTGE